jgi:hypothetical protein
MTKETVVLSKLSTRFRRADKVLQNDLAISKSIMGTVVHKAPRRGRVKKARTDYQTTPTA